MLTQTGPVPGEAPQAMRTVALPAVGPLCWAFVRRSWIAVRVAELRHDSWFVRFATLGAGAYAAVLPLVQLYRFGMQPDQGNFRYAVAATVCYLPLQVWLVLSAARSARPGGRPLALATLAALVLIPVPLIGLGWVGALYGLAALVLVSVRPPWSLVLFAVLIAMPAAVVFVLGHPEWALHFTIGVPMTAVPLAVVVWLLRAARQLQAAQRVLAQEAVVRERLRIDDELRPTVGAALEAIAFRGDRAAALATSDPVATEGELRALVAAARRALADARGMVARYQEVSLRTELATAVTLLSAAGIPTHLILPPGKLPNIVDEVARKSLRRDIARLLHDGASPAGVTIKVAGDDRRVRLELCSDGTDPAPIEAAAA